MDEEEYTPSAADQVKAVQQWMAMDLHGALGREFDHSLVNQGFRSWADWWADLCGEVRLQSQWLDK